MKRNDGFTYAETIVGILILSLILSILFPHLQSNQKKAVALWQRSHENAQLIRLVHRLESDFGSMQWKPWQPGLEVRSNGERAYEIRSSFDETPDYKISVREDEVMIQEGERISRYRIPSLKSFSLDKGDSPSTYVLNLNTVHTDIKTSLTLGSCVIGHAE